MLIILDIYYTHTPCIYPTYIQYVMWITLGYSNKIISKEKDKMKKLWKPEFHRNQESEKEIGH